MGRETKQTFSKRNLAAIPKGKPDGGSWFTFPSLPGFLLRVNADGRKTFVVRYTVKRTGQRRAVTLGRLGTVTFEQAQRKAREILAAASLGDDPRPPRALTWGEWIESYMARLDVKAPQEQRRYLGFTDEKSKRGEPTDPTFRELRRRWKDRPLDSFGAEDIDAARHEVRKGGKVKGARWLSTVSAVFGAAIRNGLLASNPAEKVKRERKAPGRDRVLSRDEMTAFLVAVDAETDPYNRAALLLLAMTGARSGELRTMEWKHLDLDARRVRLPDSKSGRPRILALPPAAVAVLEELPRIGRYVLAGRDPNVPRFDFKRLWRRVAARACIVGATPHDLRRTHGLELSRLSGIHVASLALGHTSIRTTEAVYAPESFDAIQKATDERARLLFPAAEEPKPEDK